MLLTCRVIVPILAVLVLALGAVMFVIVGRDFYPAVDGGMIQRHVRAPPGTRIEVAEQIFQAVEDEIARSFRRKTWSAAGVPSFRLSAKMGAEASITLPGMATVGLDIPGKAATLRLRINSAVL
jgi:multidrug efflux pump subunit AcrB